MVHRTNAQQTAKKKKNPSIKFFLLSKQNLYRHSLFSIFFYVKLMMGGMKQCSINWILFHLNDYFIITKIAYFHKEYFLKEYFQKVHVIKNTFETFKIQEIIKRSIFCKGNTKLNLRNGIDFISLDTKKKKSVKTMMIFNCKILVLNIVIV